MLAAGVVLVTTLGVAHAADGQDGAARLLEVPRGVQLGDARVIARYEAFSLVEAEGSAAGRLIEAGALRRDELRLLPLGGGSADGIELARRRAGALAGGLVAVQFDGPVRDAWAQRVRDAGARAVAPLTGAAVLMDASADEVRRIEKEPGVRAVVPVLAADKLGPGVEAASGDRRFSLVLRPGADGRAARERLEREARDRGSPVTVVGRELWTVTMNAVTARSLAHDPGVLSISLVVPDRLLDEAQAQIVAGNVSGVAPSGPGYLGFHDGVLGGGLTDFAIDVADTGVDTIASGVAPHPDFAVDGDPSRGSRIVYRRDWTGDERVDDCSGHGTLNASIAAGFNSRNGDGTFEDSRGYQYGLGVAPRTRITASRIFNCEQEAVLAGGANHATVVAEAYRNGARITNNSWGARTRGLYNDRAIVYDAAVRDADPAQPGNQEMIAVFSAGNEGRATPNSHTIGSPAVAKNVIAVGASENVRPFGTSDRCGAQDSHADNSNELAEFSSRGPAFDGRRKPELVAPGTHVSGARSQSPRYTGLGTCGATPNRDPINDLYTASSGTSHAAPSVSGAAAVFYEAHRRRTGTAPSPALVKAALTATAGLIAGAPNDSAGWGLVNLRSALQDSASADQSDLFGDSGAATTRQYRVADPSKPVHVALAWTDAPAPPQVEGKRLINDLDLEVRLGAATYRGNALSGGASVDGGGADRLNNLEHVRLPPGQRGLLDIAVIAAAIAGDGVPNAGDGTDQDYALFLTNVKASPGPTARAAASPDPATVSQPVRFDAGTSSDPAGTIASYEWDWNGDGAYDEQSAPNSFATHAFTAAGQHSVRLRVRNDVGQASEVAVPIRILTRAQSAASAALLRGWRLARRVRRSTLLRRGLRSIIHGAPRVTAQFDLLARPRPRSVRGSSRLVRIGRVTSRIGARGTVTVRVRVTRRYRIALRQRRLNSLRARLTVRPPRGSSTRPFVTRRSLSLRNR